jgi:uncharacterized protein (TIRG00374 family)
LTEPAEQIVRKGSLARKIVVATVLGVLVFAALTLYGDVRELRTNLEAFAWEMMALAVALATGNYALRFIRWQYYLRVLGIQIASGPSALVFLAGFVMSVTPGKIGEVFKSLLLYERYGTSMIRTAPVVVAERLTDLGALVLLTAAGALAFEHGIGVAVGGGVLVILLLFACAFRPFGDLLLRIADRTPVIKRVSARLREAYDALYAMTRPVPLVLGTGLGVLAWGLEVLSLHVILLGLPTEPLGWQATTFAYSASTIAGAVAMMPGGLGVTEAGMTGLLQALGGETMTPSVATAATMLVRLATLWWAVVVGLVALFAFRRWVVGAKGATQSCE